MSKNLFIKQLVELTNSTSNLYSCIEELDKKLTTIRESNMELASIYRILSYTKAALEFKKTSCQNSDNEKSTLTDMAIKLLDTELNLIKYHRDIWKRHPIESVKWTGEKVDLIELIYGLHEMRCINNRETTLKKLTELAFKLFGMEGKDCYCVYNAIRNRKADSRTFFLDEMRKALHKKMLKDDDAEMKR